MLNRFAKIEYFYVFLCVVWRPLQIFILGVDGAARSLAVMAVLTVLVNMKREIWLFLFRSPYKYWFFWILFTVINSLLISSSQDDAFAFIFNLLHPFLMLFVFFKCFRSYNQDMINIVIFSLYFHLVLVFSFYFDALVIMRGRDGVLNPNELSLYFFALIFFILIKTTIEKRSLIFFILMSVAPASMILVCASRTAFVGMGMVIVFFTVGRMRKNIISFAGGFALFCALAGFFSSYVVEKTLIGERLLRASEQATQSNLVLTGTFLDHLGDRGVFYYYGMKVFSEHPLLGIGLGGFVREPPLYLKNHSEYMSQLSEGGLIGFSFFATFYVSFFVLVVKSLRYRKSKDLNCVIIGSVLAILAMNLTNISYYSIPIFLIIGFVISYSRASQREYFLNQSLPASRLSDG